jgi:hypothetical protein
VAPANTPAPNSNSWLPSSMSFGYRCARTMLPSVPREPMSSYSLVRSSRPPVHPSRKPSRPGRHADRYPQGDISKMFRPSPMLSMAPGDQQELTLLTNRTRHMGLVGPAAPSPVPRFSRTGVRRSPPTKAPYGIAATGPDIHHFPAAMRKTLRGRAGFPSHAPRPG